MSTADIDYPFYYYAPVFPEGMLPSPLDLGDPLYRLNRRLHQLAVVAHRDISPFLEVDGGILRIDIIRL